MNYVEGTVLGEIIDRCSDNWAMLLGFVDPYDRERESDGTFKADDLATPGMNEAWKTGKSPKKKCCGGSKCKKKKKK